MRRIIASLVTVAAVTAAGCNLDLTNPNNPTLGGALTNPRAATARMITGVMATYRGNKAGQIQDFGSFGREIYNMFITDGRSITGPYRDWRQNNAFAAGSQWAGRYGNYRNAYAAMQIITSTSSLTDPEKSGGLGVLKTYIALDLLHVVEARGAIGAVVDMTDDANAVLPIVSQDSALKWISAKLDEANTDLSNAGATFYFPIYAGFGNGVTGANTPAAFGSSIARSRPGWKPTVGRWGAARHATTQHSRHSPVPGFRISRSRIAMPASTSSTPRPPATR